MATKNQLGESSVPAGSWRPFHKITPLADAGGLWTTIIFGLGYFSLNYLEQEAASWGLILEVITPFRLAVAVGIALGVTALFIIIGAVMWRHKSYAIVDSGVHYRKGVFLKKYQHVRWDRIQSVETEQKFFERIFGFGTVKIDAAGFNEDAVELGLLKIADCEKLRSEILGTLAQSREHVPVAVESDQISHEPEPASERDYLIYQLPTRRLLVSAMLSSRGINAVLGLLFALGWQYWVDSGLSFAALIVVFGAVISAVKYISGAYNTRIFVSEKGLRSKRGLTRVTTQVLPSTRVHGVMLRQPLLWRRFDWWYIRVTIAGGNISKAGSDDTAVALAACASGAEAIQLMSTIFPTLGTDNDGQLMQDLLYGTGDSTYVKSPPRAARWVDPIGRIAGGYFMNNKICAIRRGRIRRQVQLIFQDHTQSTGLKQGILQRWLGLASLKVHLVPGPCDGTLKNFDLETMSQLLVKQNELTAQARKLEVSETIEEWQTRLGLRS